jgi:hypothetical protein
MRCCGLVRHIRQTEVVQQIARYQSQLLDLVPEAINVYQRALASGDLPLATATATKLFGGIARSSTGAGSSRQKRLLASFESPTADTDHAAR